MTDDAGFESEACRVCGDVVPVDGENAIERWGGVLCRDCSDEPVAFKATCSSQLCNWTFLAENNEFNRGHVETRAHQEANQHERSKAVFDDNPMHRTTVEEVLES